MGKSIRDWNAELRGNTEISIHIAGAGIIGDVSEKDLKSYRKSPIKWISAFLGCTPEEYVAFLEADEPGICTATTKKGDRCSMFIGPFGVEDWIERRRDGTLLCDIHMKMQKDFHVNPKKYFQKTQKRRKP